MDLLPDDLRSRLPPLHAQEAEADPVVYTRYFLPQTDRNWYVCEGQAEDDDYLFFGFVTAADNDFRCFLLSELKALRGAQGQCVDRDMTFPEGRLTDVVPAPDL